MPSSTQNPLLIMKTVGGSMRSFVQQRTVRKWFDVTSTKVTQCQPVAYGGMRSPVGESRLSSLLTRPKMQLKSVAVARLQNLSRWEKSRTTRVGNSPRQKQGTRFTYTVKDEHIFYLLDRAEIV